MRNRTIITIFFLIVFLFIGCGGADKLEYDDEGRLLGTPKLSSSAYAAHQFPVLHWIDDTIHGGGFHDYHLAGFNLSTLEYDIEQIGNGGFAVDWEPQWNSVIYMADGRWGIVASRWDAPFYYIDVWLSDSDSWDISDGFSLALSTQGSHLNKMDFVVHQDYITGVALYESTNNLIVGSCNPDISPSWDVIVPFMYPISDIVHMSATKPKDLSLNLSLLVYTGESNDLCGVINNERFMIGEALSMTGEIVKLLHDSNSNSLCLDRVGNELWMYSYPAPITILSNPGGSRGILPEVAFQAPEALLQFDAVHHGSDDSIHAVVHTECCLQEVTVPGPPYAITDTFPAKDELFISGNHVSIFTVGRDIRVTDNPAVPDDDYVVVGVNFNAGQNRTEIQINYNITTSASGGTVSYLISVVDGFVNGLFYGRRTKASGWDWALLTSWGIEDEPGAVEKQRARSFPQISIDTYGNIQIYFVELLEGEELGTEYDIVQVNQVFRRFYILGDHSGEFGIGDTIRVSGSTGNDGDYTITDVNLAIIGIDTATQISVQQIVPNPVADGVLQKVEEGEPYGDLRGFYLDRGYYEQYDNPANWAFTTDIDDSEEDILGCLTIGNHPLMN